MIDRPRVRKQTKHYNSFEEDELMEFSELDSDSDERPTRSRRLNDKTRRYLRAECFRVEKNLLIFGWVFALPVCDYSPVPEMCPACLPSHLRAPGRRTVWESRREMCFLPTARSVIGHSAALMQTCHRFLVRLSQQICY